MIQLLAGWEVCIGKNRDRGLENARTQFFPVRTDPKAPVKRSQHANATYPNIVGRNMLRAFGHRVAMCCDMLTIFKFEPTTRNMLQHVATGWPNARNMLRPTMLRHVALACCDRLAGA